MKHFYKSVPGWFSFAGVYEDAVKRAGDGSSTFVEVGCWKGKSAAFMAVEIANSRKPIRFYCVDHWLGSDEATHHADPDVRDGKLFEVFSRNVAPARNFIIPLRMSSVDAASTFKDGAVDLVMLDGGHDYASVRADLDAWCPKLRDDGILAGDDYNWGGVRKALDETFRADQIEVLGEGKGRHWRVRL